MKNKKRRAYKYASGKSYLKMLLGMLAGAVVGASLSFAFFFGGEAVGQAVGGGIRWIGMHGVLLMGILLALGLVLGIYGYGAMKKLGRQLQEAEQAEEPELDEDELEYRLDFVGGGVMALNNVLVVLSIPLLVITMENGAAENGGRMAMLLVLFLLNSGWQAMLQVRLIRLIQKIDPRKHGDPGDLNFQKEWLAGCDEAERQRIYRAAYQTQQFTALFILIGMVAMVLCHLIWDTGLIAVLIMAATSIAQCLASYRYSLQLEKKARK